MAQDNPYLTPLTKDAIQKVQEGAMSAISITGEYEPGAPLTPGYGQPGQILVSVGEDMPQYEYDADNCGPSSFHGPMYEWNISGSHVMKLVHENPMVMKAITTRIIDLDAEETVKVALIEYEVPRGL